MAKIAVCMPYYDRQYQLDKTLVTLAQSAHKDFVVVIADDNSPTPLKLPDLGFEIDYFKVGKKTWVNCAPVHNMAFHRAMKHRPDIIMIQSPECYHVGDVLSHAVGHLTGENYIAYACFHLNKETTLKPHDIEELSKTDTVISTNGGDNGWWNHSTKYYQPQYWCAAITTENLMRVNGIDERFADGYAIEDGWFIDQIQRAGMRIDVVDYPFVVHQWHNRVYPRNCMALVEKNKRLWNELKKTTEYRSVHHITPDLA